MLSHNWVSVSGASKGDVCSWQWEMLVTRCGQLFRYDTFARGNRLR
jgi:hypothetical protein